MQNAFLKLLIKAQAATASLQNEEGQDLIEYALVVALVALAATAGMGTLANSINNAFAHIGTLLNTYIG